MKLLFILESHVDIVDAGYAKKIIIPNDMKEWTEQQKALIEAYDVFDGLRKFGCVFVDEDLYDKN